jgi:hypothetical protein
MTKDSRVYLSGPIDDHPGWVPEEKWRGSGYYKARTRKIQNRMTDDGIGWIVNRIQILSDLHQQSVDNIATNEAVIAAGFAEYVKGTDSKVHAVFARADAAMYKEKMLLKGMGAKSGR